ncbi:MAG: methyltransferase domain-containing protein [Deltaproteobacteria bacterium]|nr:methyltransferase domain-containing protein [Deltaproteobacteria bacterium]
MPEKTPYGRLVKLYERVAPIYDWLCSGYLDCLKAALETLHLTGKERILDVACGTGELERQIVERFPAQSIIGVDITEGMLKQARTKLAHAPNVEFRYADGGALPLADSDFDIVISCGALHYMREPNRFLAEAARVLVPGGRCIIVGWCRDFLRGKVYNWFHRVFSPWHHYVHTVSELEALMRSSGLTPTRSNRFTVNVIWGMMCVEATKAI